MRPPLLSDNPYLRDPATRDAALLVSAASSSAVEGIRKPFAELRKRLKPAARMSRAVAPKLPKCVE